MERLQLGHRDENDNCLLATTDINFAGSRNLEGSELSLEFGDIVFEINQSLCDARLGFVGACSGRIGSAEDLVLNGHGET